MTSLTVRCRPAQHADLEEAFAGSARLYLYDPKFSSVDTINTTLVSSVGLTMVSGFGGLLGFYIPGYVERSYLASPRICAQYSRLTLHCRWSDLFRYHASHDFPDDVHGRW
jgi:hypothetical protein